MRRLLPGPTSPAWVAAETLGAAVTSLFGLLFIARLIGPHSAGTGAIAASAFLTVDFPIAALFGDALLQRRDLEEAHRSSAFWATAAVALLAAAGLALLAPRIAVASGAAELTPMIRSLACLLPFSAAAGLLASLALRGRRYGLLAARVLLCQPFAIGTGIGVALAGGGAWAMVAQQAAATLSVFLLLAALIGWHPLPLFRRHALAELWPVAGPQVLALLVMNGRYRVFVLGLGMVVAEAVVAVTHIAFRLLDVALAVVTGATARLAMPRLAALQHDRAALARAYGELTQLQALIGLPVTVGMAIAAPRLVELLLGGPWLAAAGPARLVALAAVPLLLVGPASALWLAVGRTRMNLLMHAIAFAVPLLLLALLRPAGPEGAALCWIGGSLAVPPVQLWLILRELGRPLSWLLGQLLVPVAATLAMAGAAGWVALRMAGEPAIAALPVTALAGAAVYLLAVLLALRGRWPRALLEA